MFEYPPDSNMGDIAFPCFKLSKILRKAPPIIAKELAEKFNSSIVSKIEAVNGYLNIFVSNEYLLNNALLQSGYQRKDSRLGKECGHRPHGVKKSRGEGNKGI